MVVLRGRYNPFNLAAFNARLDHGLLLGLTGQGAGGGANDHGLGSDDSPTFVGATLSGLLTAKTGRTTTLVVAANDSSTTSKAQADYVCDGSDDDVQIQAALDALPSGGGEARLFEGTFVVGTTIAPTQDNWTLSGQGRGTIVKLKDSGDTNILKINDGITDWVIKDIFFDGNKANQTDTTKPVIYIDNTSRADLHSMMHNIWVENGKGVGIYAIVPRRVHLVQSIVENCDSHGIHITDEHLELYGTRILSNGGDGFHADDMADNRFVGSFFQSNTGAGVNEIRMSQVTNSIFYNNGGDGISSVHSSSLVGCLIQHNDGHGVVLVNYSSLIGSRISNNSSSSAGTNDNVRITSFYNMVLGNRIGTLSGPADKDIEITINAAVDNIIVGNVFRKETGSVFVTATEDYTWENNSSPDETILDQKGTKYKNTSGGQLVRGDVIVLKSVAAADEITTTTTQGDDKVLGMVRATIENNARGRILLLGKTVYLKVNGTDDIAVGDFLGTFTSAGIAMKATAGDMAFAIALEAYSTDDSSGVINALLITPRKI